MSALLVASILIAQSHSACNLLETGNNAYIDTESENAITTMCAKDKSSLSLWEQYQCDAITYTDGYQKCWPQRLMSTCQPGQLKGAVLLYHGFSACPDQYADLAPKLADECYHVYLPTTLGHGYEFCDDANVTNCAAGYANITFMPNTRQPFIDVVQNVIIPYMEDEVSIIKECELAANPSFDVSTLEVGVGGLSFGAPLSAATVVLSGEDSIFTKHILMSPFFGISYNGIDNIIYKCLLNAAAFEDCLPDYFKGIGFDISDDESVDFSDLVMDAISHYVNLAALDTSFETFNLMIRKVLEWIIEDPDSIPLGETREDIEDILDNIMSWGPECESDISERDRGGFCQFKIRNLLAAHSFGAYITDYLTDAANKVDTGVEIMLIMVERDGPTRNSLAVDYVNKYYANNATLTSMRATDCMWLIDSACQVASYNGSINNVCGVPHSSMSPKDNLGKPPNELWWADWYHEGVIDFLNGESDYGDHFLVKDGWDGSRNQCQYLDILDPPEVLVADVPNLLTLGFRIVGGVVTDSIQASILDALSAATGIERGVLELTVSIVDNLRNGAIDDTDNDYVEITVSLDGDSTNILETILDNNGGKEFGNQTVEYVNLEGTEYVVESVDNNPKTTGDGYYGTTKYGYDGKEDENGTRGAGAWIAVIVVLMLIVVILVAVLYKKMSDDGKKQSVNNNGLGIEMNTKDTTSGGGDTAKETLMDNKETNDETHKVDEESDSESVIPSGKPTKR